MHKRYDTITALDGLSLEVRRGEIFGLLGPNGAGKTTTVNVAVGLLLPDSGSVTIEGSGSPRAPAARSRMGVAPQSLALYETLSGEQNLRYLGRIYGPSGSRLAEHVDRALDTVPDLLAAHGARTVLVAEVRGETVRVATDGPMAELLRLAAAGPPGRFRVGLATLEQVFLNLTGRELRD